MTAFPTGKKRIKGEVLDIAHLYRHARSGATLLTPNLRAARLLRKQLQAHARLHAGKYSEAESAVFERVTHWRGWIHSLWQATLLQGLEDRALLQPLQERVLWEAVVDADERLHCTEALIGLCLAASARVHQYGAAAAVIAHASTNGRDDTVRFARWFRAVEQRCARERLLSMTAVESALVQTATRLSDTQTSELVLCHVQGLLPTQQELLRACASAGMSLLQAEESSEPHPTHAVLLRCSDESQELLALATHLRDALASDSRPSLAVVVPDLSIARERIDRTLREALTPATESIFREERRPLWEFSTGRPLLANAVVADALRLLQWTTRELEAGEVSMLLRSPFLVWPVSPELAAELDTGLLRRGNRIRPTWSARSAAQQLAKANATLSEALEQRTHTWWRLHGFTSSYTAHTERCRELLREFGWPGARTRSSEEFQVVQRFESSLDALAALDVVTSHVSWNTFVDRLRSVVRTTAFAPENTGAPIQFLTPEESTGLTAQEVWVAHADESRWNSSAGANPLLPWVLQQRLGMPGVDPARDQALFMDRLQGIVAATPSLTFSYAHTGEAGEQRPCALLEQLPRLVKKDAPASTVLDAVAAASALEDFEDDVLVPLALTETPVAGGVSVLKSQAACAFRAFAERRLGSAKLDNHDLGLDARDRGNVLHHALHIFWKGTTDKAGLLDLMSTGRLPAAVRHAVQQALRPQHDASDRWALQYQAIEQERLERLVLRWLDYESKRPDFRVVATEEAVAVTVGALPLQVRVDRVDVVKGQDGAEYRVIIDYKTGDLNQRHWEGERPEEPQLPLYAATARTATDVAPGVGAIAFGVVRAGDKLQFQSLPRKSALLLRDEKATPDVLGVELDTWKQTLETLADDFAAGIAAVGPKQYPGTCRFCDQRLLCRLNPELLDLNDDDGEGEA